MKNGDDRSKCLLSGMPSFLMGLFTFGCAEAR
jgi:hypothetical protein